MDLDDIDKNPFDKAAHDIYSLYFAGWLFGFLAFIIGFAWAIWQLNKDKVPALYQSHYKFQMSIALQGFLFLLIAVLAWYICYPYLNLLHWWRAVIITILTIFVPIYWWLKRCVIGFKLLRHNQLIINPLTLLWPKSNGTSTKG